jgi:hypothetical protein
MDCRIKPGNDDRAGYAAGTERRPDNFTRYLALLQNMKYVVLYL